MWQKIFVTPTQDDARRQKWSLYVASAKAGRRHKNSWKITVTKYLWPKTSLIVSDIIQVKKEKILSSFWTFDGKIYVKLDEVNDRHEITSVHELKYLLTFRADWHNPSIWSWSHLFRIRLCDSWNRFFWYMHIPKNNSIQVQRCHEMYYLLWKT